MEAHTLTFYLVYWQVLARQHTCRHARRLSSKLGPRVPRERDFTKRRYPSTGFSSRLTLLSQWAIPVCELFELQKKGTSMAASSHARTEPLREHTVYHTLCMARVEVRARAWLGLG